MGVVLMSKRELNRIDILARLDGGRLTTAAAADLMRITLRQTHRLLKRYRDGGASAIANRRRGRPSNNRLPDLVRDHAIALVRKYYADFGPTLAAEKLGERHDVRVSRETLRGWMRQAGICLPRGECLDGFDQVWRHVDSLCGLQPVGGGSRTRRRVADRHSRSVHI